MISINEHKKIELINSPSLFGIKIDWCSMQQDNSVDIPFTKVCKNSYHMKMLAKIIATLKTGEIV